MKPITESVSLLINDENLLKNLQKLSTSHPDTVINESTFEEVFNEFIDIKEAINESINKEYFEDIAFNRRNALNNNLKNLQKFSSDQNRVIQQFHSVKDQVQLMGLMDIYLKNLNFSKEFKEVASLRRKYRNIEKDLSNAKSINNEIAIISKKSNESYTTISEIEKKSLDLKEKIDLERSEIEHKLKLISDSEQEVEDRKQQIIAFQKKIESTEEKILSIEGELGSRIKEDIDTKLISAKKLIEEAETALELKQTEGISAAYSSRLGKLSNTKRNTFWLIGSIAFMLLTLILGFLIAGINIEFGSFSIGFNAEENIGFLIGRIILTGIGLGGAIFCANRYVNLKNLEEDYEYKVVLSKSILAFSNKISEIDKDRLPEYLIRVLDELHQDPLRDRKNKNSKEFDISMLNQLKILLDKWKEMN
ncbi:MAG: hypothetical protein JXR11_12280 [Balneola sp.]